MRQAEDIALKLHRGLGINDADYQTAKYTKVGPNKR